MNKKSNYVSCFKINGLPILPPLMTTEKRREMRKYREMAIEIEKKLITKKEDSDEIDSNLSLKNFTSVQYDKCTGNKNKNENERFQDNKEDNNNYNDYMKASNNLLEYLENRESLSMPLKYKKQQNLQKSDTFIYDIKSNTVIVPYERQKHENEEFISPRKSISSYSSFGTKASASTGNTINVLYNPYKKGEQHSHIIKANPSVNTVNETKKCLPTEKPKELQNLSPPLNPDGRSKQVMEHSSPEKSRILEDLQNIQKSISTGSSSTHMQSSQSAITKSRSSSSPRTVDIPHGLIHLARSATSPSFSSPFNSQEEQIHSTYKELLNSGLLKDYHSNCSDYQNNFSYETDGGESFGECSNLVRSNSFTLESPSKALLEHLAKQKSFPEIVNPCKTSTLRKPVSIPEKKKEKEKKNAGLLKSSCARGTSLFLTNTGSLYKTKRCPYDSKAPGKVKSRKHKTSAVKSVSSTNIKSKVRSGGSLKKSPEIKKGKAKGNVVKTSTSSTTTFTKSVADSESRISALRLETEDIDKNQIINLLKNVSLQDQERILELFRRQQEEKERIEKQFGDEQERLLKELSSNKSPFNSGNLKLNENDLKQQRDIAAIVTYRPESSDKSLRKETSSKTVSNCRPNENQQNRNNVFTLPGSNTANFFSGGNLTQSPTGNNPRRQLFFADDSNLFTNNSTISSNSNANRRGNFSPTKRNKKESEAAATIINAYARGYLVRRLFKTEYVHNIVKTIRDTLTFVIELHIETKNDDSEQNIRLKARLLQQLTSATYSLRQIFSILPIKERMEIISRDRVYKLKKFGSPRTTL